MSSILLTERELFFADDSFDEPEDLATFDVFSDELLLFGEPLELHPANVRAAMAAAVIPINFFIIIPPNPRLHEDFLVLVIVAHRLADIVVQRFRNGKCTH